ncbi:hypothetical protein BESB_025600 [Besnoitia besnoiti]|uniref:Uncharacterized protein n=1 Tax=Besnoitia besnoiti TaxID=94643 RepID=A0A2A9M6R6_BESBE|nr:uncharacterized protein BESB_025600 [Besnoitia besnoiti]PFH31586.1 hypothetical protein BESB_025600 [Besnoitia besnoiti]
MGSSTAASGCHVGLDKIPRDSKSRRPLHRQDFQEREKRADDGCSWASVAGNQTRKLSASDRSHTLEFGVLRQPDAGATAGELQSEQSGCTPGLPPVTGPSAVAGPSVRIAAIPFVGREDTPRLRGEAVTAREVRFPGPTPFPSNQQNRSPELAPTRASSRRPETEVAKKNALQHLLSVQIAALQTQIENVENDEAVDSDMEQFVQEASSCSDGGQLPAFCRTMSEPWRPPQRRVEPSSSAAGDPQQPSTHGCEDTNSRELPSKSLSVINHAAAALEQPLTWIDGVFQVELGALPELTQGTSPHGTNELPMLPGGPSEEQDPGVEMDEDMIAEIVAAAVSESPWAQSVDWEGLLQTHSTSGDASSAEDPPVRDEAR